MDALQKRVPFSVEAEQSVLGSIIIDPERFDEVAQIICADDFYIEEHKDIFRALISGDPEKARSEMERHMRAATQHLQGGR